MQNETSVTFSKDTKRPLVVRSLRRSDIRKRIAEYLFEISPSGSYTSEIAYNVKTTPTNVLGAIRGMGTRYKEDESLIALNLVEQIESENKVKIYKLTDFGKDIINSLKKP
jgi:predicted transcriptional regulator with HTH domain